MKTPIIYRDVAQIVRVPETNQASFCRLVGHAVSTAQKESSRTVGKNISAGALTRDFFNPVVRAAKKLCIGLERLQGEHLLVGEAPRSMAAAHFFSAALQPLSPKDADDPIAHLLRSLNLGLVIEVAECASERAKRRFSKAGRKKGTGSIVFDIFVMQLVAASEQNGGRLTIYKTAYEKGHWAGTLPKAVQHLRPMLPKTNFYPAGTLGYSLHTVYRRWRSEAGKSLCKKG